MQAASLTYQAEADEETESDTEFLPNWVMKSEVYEPVLVTTQDNTVLLSPQKTWANQWRTDEKAYDGFFSD